MNSSVVLAGMPTMVAGMPTMVAGMPTMVFRYCLWECLVCFHMTHHCLGTRELISASSHLVLASLGVECGGLELTLVGVAVVQVAAKRAVLTPRGHRSNALGCRLSSSSSHRQTRRTRRLCRSKSHGD